VQAGRAEEEEEEGRDLGGGIEEGVMGREGGGSDRK